MGTPNIPEDRAAVVRQAFAEMLRDQQFVADAIKRDIDVSMLNAPDLQKMVSENFLVAPDLVEKLRTVTSPPR